MWVPYVIQGSIALVFLLTHLSVHKNQKSGLDGVGSKGGSHSGLYNGHL